MSRGATPLQTWTSALFALLVDARDDLDERAYSAFVSVTCVHIAREAARLLLGDLMRRDQEQRPT